MQDRERHSRPREWHGQNPEVSERGGPRGAAASGQEHPWEGGVGRGRS